MSVRARLGLRHLGAYHYLDPADQSRALPALELRVRFDVVRRPDELDGIMQEGVVATGEPFSVFPRPHWELFEDRITWFRQHPRYPQPEDWLYRGTCPFRLGQVHAVVYDFPTPDGVSPLRRMRARAVVGLFLNHVMPGVAEPLIGLRHSLLTGRRVVAEPALDDPANFHERWWLEAVDWAGG